MSVCLYVCMSVCLYVCMHVRAHIKLQRFRNFDKRTTDMHGTSLNLDGSTLFVAMFYQQQSLFLKDPEGKISPLVMVFLNY